MTSLGKLKGLYGFVFSFPGLRVIAVLSAALYAAWFALRAVHGDLLGPAVAAAAVFAVWPLALRLSSPVFTYRRGIALAPAFFAWAAVVEALYGRAVPLAALLSPLAAALYLAARFLSPRPRRALLILAVPAVLYTVDPPSPAWLAASLAPLALVAAVAEAVAAVVGRRFEEKLGLGFTESFYAFISYLLLGDRRSFEESFLRQSAVRRRIPVYLLKLVTEGGNLAIVVPHIHPGPFRDVGSSAMPSLILERCGGRCLVLHGASTHAEDAALRGEVEAVVEEVVSRVGSPPTTPLLRLYSPTELRLGRLRGFVLPFDGGALVAVSPASGGLEDIPFSVAQMFAGRAVVVDAHNSLTPGCPSPEPGTPLYEEVVKLVEKSLEVGRANPIVRAGCAYTPYRSLDVCSGVAAVALENARGEKFCIVCFDGNNMTVEARAALEEALGSAGFSAYLVATTDSHLLSGARVGVDYHPVGAYTDLRTLSELAVETARKAVEGLAPLRGAAVEVVNAEILALRGDVLSSLNEVAGIGKPVAAAIVLTLTACYLAPLLLLL